MSPLSYPPYALDVSTDCQALTTYQSQLLWIGKCDRNNDNIKVFVLEDEATDSWNEVMQDIPQLSHTYTPQSRAPIIKFISATSEGNYLVVVESMRYQGLSILLYNGQDWRRIDIPSPPSSAHGDTDIVIYNGTVYLSTRVGFYEVSLASLAASHFVWKSLACVSKEFCSNLTVFCGHIVILNATQASMSRMFIESDDAGYIDVLAYLPIADTWVLVEKIKCYLCWMVPSIVGLPTGHLLILGVALAPDPVAAPQFNIIQVTACLKGIYNIMYV